MGYCGGPQTSDDVVTYDTVCDGDGNTEVVRVRFDPSITSYENILREFWEVSGSRATKRRPKAQYKSAIYFNSEEQRLAAVASMEAKLEELTRQAMEKGGEGGGDVGAGAGMGMQKSMEVEVVTEILPMNAWHDAEERHQGYVMKHRAVKAKRAAEAQVWVNAWSNTSSSSIAPSSAPSSNGGGGGGSD